MAVSYLQEKGAFFLGGMDTTWGTDTTFENFFPHIYSLVMYFSFLCVNNCYDRCNKSYHIVKRLQGLVVSKFIWGVQTLQIFLENFIASFEKL